MTGDKYMSHDDKKTGPKSCAIPGSLLLLAGLLAFLAGCERKMDISDQDLVAEMIECAAETDKTPGRAVACGNYARECRRRGKETGNYIC